MVHLPKYWLLALLRPGEMSLVRNALCLGRRELSTYGLKRNGHDPSRHDVILSLKRLDGRTAVNLKPAWAIW